ncbi:hypothetical protein PM082_000362 [Marasmius tenuissimus]|nr:hypothetical protein PM082_000362 [Marasmius tenuissimus]
MPLPELKDDNSFRAPHQKELPAIKSGKTAPTRSAKPAPGVAAITRTRCSSLYLPTNLARSYLGLNCSASPIYKQHRLLPLHSPPVLQPKTHATWLQALCQGLTSLLKQPHYPAGRLPLLLRMDQLYQLYQLLLDRIPLKPPQPQVRRAYHNVPSPLKERPKANLKI